ncbi:MAG: hypothetical protein LJE70_04920 [Chromatiaceae bacterium]|jgi:hypothetical protein|nr:hypothetical protein [Chromatiaceae bacterium]
MRKVGGIKIDKVTGELKVVFFVDDTTTTFQPLIGPKDERVLLLTNMKLNVEKEPVKGALFTENYTEQLTWRAAATGKILAESDFFEPLSINGLTPPGFGDRIYFPTAVGTGFYVLQVMPKPAPDKGNADKSVSCEGQEQRAISKASVVENGAFHESRLSERGPIRARDGFNQLLPSACEIDIRKNLNRTRLTDRR